MEVHNAVSPQRHKAEQDLKPKQQVGPAEPHHE